jgi:hypothetical protein
MSALPLRVDMLGVGIHVRYVPMAVISGAVVDTPLVHSRKKKPRTKRGFFLSYGAQ